MWRKKNKWNYPAIPFMSFKNNIKQKKNINMNQIIWSTNKFILMCMISTLFFFFNLAEHYKSSTICRWNLLISFDLYRFSLVILLICFIRFIFYFIYCDNTHTTFNNRFRLYLVDFRWFSAEKFEIYLFIG